MAVDNHNSQIKHSLYGRLAGLDHRNLAVFGGGDIRYGTETLGTTVASTLAPGGTSILAATAAAVFELIPPSATMIGVRKRLISNTTGAVAQLAKLTAGNFTANGLTTQNTLTLSTRGVGVDLEYISTALVMLMTPISSLTTPFYSLSTTT